MGHEGDPVQDRAPWAIDGSFLAFRYLCQNVPEFDNFLRDHPVPLPGLTPEEGSELLGARLVGRWKSGSSRFSQTLTRMLTSEQVLPLT